MPRKITITSGYEGSHIAFYLRPISLYEEQQHLARFAEVKDLKEPARGPEITKICIDSIAEWSAEAPRQLRRREDADGFDEIPREETGGGIADEVRDYFARLDPVDAERIANDVVLKFRVKLQPDTVF
ncbi:MAG TPA: hypothetical protein DEP46_07200 [Blastocatellia bacterium]|nr:hypothetical protein [Blastocatellia bacterium]